MSNKRKFDDLTDMDKGVFIVREEINVWIEKYRTMHKNKQQHEGDEYGYIAQGLGFAYRSCNDLLKITILGEIEK